MQEESEATLVLAPTDFHGRNCQRYRGNGGIAAEPGHSSGGAGDARQSEQARSLRRRCLMAKCLAKWR